MGMMMWGQKLATDCGRRPPYVLWSYWQDAVKKHEINHKKYDQCGGGANENCFGLGGVYMGFFSADGAVMALQHAFFSCEYQRLSQHLFVIWTKNPYGMKPPKICGETIYHF